MVITNSDRGCLKLREEGEEDLGKEGRAFHIRRNPEDHFRGDDKDPVPGPGGCRGESTRDPGDKEEGQGQFP